MNEQEGSIQRAMHELNDSALAQREAPSETCRLISPSVKVLSLYADEMRTEVQNWSPQRFVV
jgi:hypothetical protein